MIGYYFTFPLSGVRFFTCKLNAQLAKVSMGKWARGSYQMKNILFQLTQLVNMKWQTCFNKPSSTSYLFWTSA